MINYLSLKKTVRIGYVNEKLEIGVGTLTRC